jgi:hypothetical protein
MPNESAANIPMLIVVLLDTRNAEPVVPNCPSVKYPVTKREAIAIYGINFFSLWNIKSAVTRTINAIERTISGIIRLSE